MAVVLVLVAGHLAQARAQAPEPELIVVGGGPAGLLAAIQAKRQRPGDRIVVLERRDAPTRSNVIVVGNATLDRLARAGLDVADGAFMPLDFQQLKLPDMGPARDLGVRAALRGAARRPLAAAVDLIELPTASIGIDVLEGKLEALASSLGVEIDRGAEVEAMAPSGDGQRVDVRLANGRRLSSRFAVVASGTKAPFMAALGVTHAEDPRSADPFVLASVKRPFGGVRQQYHRVRSASDGHESLVIGYKDRTSVAVWLPRGTDPSKLAPEVADRMIRDALGDAVGDGPIEYLQRPTGISTTDRRAKRVAFGGGRILLVGDAAHSGSPRAGMGVQEALYTAERAVATIEEGRTPRGSLQRGARRYERDLARSSQAVARFNGGLLGLHHRMRGLYDPSTRVGAAAQRFALKGSEARSQRVVGGYAKMMSGMLSLRRALPRPFRAASDRVMFGSQKALRLPPPRLGPK